MKILEQRQKESNPDKVRTQQAHNQIICLVASGFIQCTIKVLDSNLHKSNE